MKKRKIYKKFTNLSEKELNANVSSEMFNWVLKTHLAKVL